MEHVTAPAILRAVGLVPVPAAESRVSTSGRGLRRLWVSVVVLIMARRCSVLEIHPE